MSVLDHAAENPMRPEEQATIPLAGGIMNYGYQCGMLWGAALASGAQAYRLFGAGPQAETMAIMATQKVVESFRSQNKDEINCLEISHLNMQGQIKISQIAKFFIKGGPIGCLRMIVRYVPEAFQEIKAGLAENTEAPSPPVSCAAMLAQKMGALEMHTVMAAGFAGGIGLSGGACGALGAAIWIIGMNGRKERVENKVINARIADKIDRFIKSKTADFRFECSEIVGRQFESVADHAGYLRDGGCAEIIELLATK